MTSCSGGGVGGRSLDDRVRWRRRWSQISSNSQQQQQEEGVGAELAGIDSAPFSCGAQFLPDRRVVDFFRILADSPSSRRTIPYVGPVVDPRRRAGRTPSAHDSDPHTAVPVCRITVRDTVIPTNSTSVNDERIEPSSMSNNVINRNSPTMINVTEVWIFDCHFAWSLVPYSRRSV